MSLRQLAESDLGNILEDGTTGFGWPITLTDPTGFTGSGPLTGFSDDIAQLIDPDTGQAVSGRLASVALRISSLIAEGFAMPQGIADAGSKPWLVTFDDINGNSFTFKVAQSNPDRALGLVTCLLEFYE
jgi:hypothetical protein